MSIQRKSEMVGLNIRVLPDRSVQAEATYASGAWDGDKQEWVGQPHMLTEPFNSFAHDAGRIKSIVGQMLLRVAQGHEVLKASHAQAVADGFTLLKNLGGEQAAHDVTKDELNKVWARGDRLERHNADLQAQIIAQPVARKNPLLHRLTGGRAGR